MRYRLFNPLLPLIFTALLAACKTTPHRDGGATNEATADDYTKENNAKAVVLVDVNWGRRWSCGDFQTAQLRAIGFDRTPLVKTKNDDTFDLVLLPSQAQGSSGYDSFALLVAPGEYALSGFMIIATRTAGADSQPLTTYRSNLIKGGKPQGGTFNVKAGETVYIGNFTLDCSDRPRLARAYTKGASNYKAHLAEYKRKYPFIQTEQVIFRLFQTTLYGEPRTR